MAPPAPIPPLRLRAEDDEDLAVFAAMMQDAVGRVGDLVYLPRHHRFAGVFTRFCWEQPRGRFGERFARIQTGLHFDTVRAARTRGVPLDRRDAILSLLHLDSAPSPAGVTIRLIFSGGAELRLDAECVDAHLSDFGQRWYTRHCPHHPFGDPSA